MGVAVRADGSHLVLAVDQGAIPSIEPGKLGYSTNYGTSFTEAKVSFDCAAQCASAGFCCNTDTRVGAGERLSCLQACDIRKTLSQAACLGHCDEVEENRGCSRNIPFWKQPYGMCMQCPDATSNPKCTATPGDIASWGGVSDRSACDYGCTLDPANAKKACNRNNASELHLTSPEDPRWYTESRRHWKP